MSGSSDARNTNWENFGDDISYSQDSLNSTSSSSSSSSSSQSNGPLYELSELMNNLPLKRGLSMFYEGKAESFSSLGLVESIEDLPKKEKGYRKKMKACKSFGVGLDSHRILYSPKASISKKTPTGSSFPSFLTKRGNFLRGSRSSSISVQKEF